MLESNLSARNEAMDGTVRIALLEGENERLRRRDAEREAQLLVRERRIRLLEEALRVLNADRFGASREKLHVAPGQAELFNEAEALVELQATPLLTLAAEVSRTYQIEIDCIADGWISQQVPAETAHHIFRIAQEAFNNAKRHGQATIITVTLRAQDGVLNLAIVDNGVGMQDPIREDQGSGLKIMYYRAQILGGTIAVEPGVSGGTQIIFRCPMNHGANPLGPFTQKAGSCECIASVRRVGSPIRMGDVQPKD